MKKLKLEFNIDVIAGNIATGAAAEALANSGVDAVKVGIGPGSICTTRIIAGIGVPQLTAVMDVYEITKKHHIPLIADGGIKTSGDIAKAIVCGADAVMVGSPLAAATEAPGQGFHWGMATFHPTLPRGTRVETTTRGTLKEILLGPATQNDGRLNLFGGLRNSMSTCGYQTLKEFQKAEIMVAPALQTEGKYIQKQQGVGMG